MRRRLRTPYVPAMGRFTSSDEINATIARTAPAILELLGDGIVRNRRTIVAALADRYPKDEVERTLMRLAVTDQVIRTGGRYSLGSP